jgi:hypothetical protein
LQNTLLLVLIGIVRHLQTPSEEIPGFNLVLFSVNLILVFMDFRSSPKFHNTVLKQKTILTFHLSQY